MSAETALITGASSGIGCELARLFAADKSNLVLVARRQEKLDELAAELRRDYGVQVRVLAKDLADPQSPQAIFDALAAESVTVDVLVNNAGFGAVGPVAALPVERQMDMVQVNVSRPDAPDQAVPAGDDRARSGRHSQRGLNRRLSAGAEHGGLLRHESLRPFLHRGPGRRVGRIRRQGDLSGSWPHRNWVWSRFGNGKVHHLQTRDDECEDGRSSGLSRFSPW